MLKYSALKKRLKIEVDKSDNNGLAHFTHYLQNCTNGVSQHYKKHAEGYLSQIRYGKDELTMDNILPLRFDVPFPPPSNHEFSFIDLFAGIGGFRIPMQDERGKCVFTSEFNFHAKRAYELNFGEVPFGDITNIELDTVPKHDILTAGFPCQPFSISGKMKGFEDTRGTLIYNVFKIIEIRQPKVIFLENVKHLLHHNKGETLKTIIKGLEDLGYKTVY
jgi:DNA (cytosine-5)-methyltransferase 1